MSVFAGPSADAADPAVPIVDSSAPIIRVCRKRSADPHCALVVNLKRHKTDGVLFSLFKTVETPQIANIDEQLPPLSKVIDFPSTVSPLDAVANAVGEIGGAPVPSPNRRRPVDNDVITVNGRPLVPVRQGPAEDEWVYDFYKISRGATLNPSGGQEVSDTELEMRFATIDEVNRLWTGSESSSDVDADDDEDSNDEDNWRNDYPDEDDCNTNSEESADSDAYGYGLDSDEEGLCRGMDRVGMEDYRY